MALSGDLEFDHVDRKRIYDYVEARGAVATETVRTDLRIDPSGFRHHLAILKRDGLITETNGTVAVEIAAGGSETHHLDGVEVTVRPARQQDLPGIVGAIRQVALEGDYIEAESVGQELDREQVLLRHNELESRMFFVATVEDDVVGWVHLYAPELEKLAHTAELTVGVIDAYRGNGIGSRLLQRGLSWAADRDFDRLYNSVPATNGRAIDFLKGHEWEIEAVREDHYRIDGDYVDEVMMAVEL